MRATTQRRSPPISTRPFPSSNRCSPATPAEAPLRPRYLEDIGGGLLARYRRTWRTGGSRGGDHGPPPVDRRYPDQFPFPRGPPLQPRARADRAQQSHDLGADLQAAVAAMREACRSGLTVAPAIVLWTAQEWGRWASARGAWAEAAEAHGHGLAAIDRLYESQLLPGAKQTWLGAAQGLAVAAAYALGADRCPGRCDARPRARPSSRAHGSHPAGSGRPCRRRGAGSCSLRGLRAGSGEGPRAREPGARDRGRPTRSDLAHATRTTSRTWPARRAATCGRRSVASNSCQGMRRFGCSS